LAASQGISIIPISIERGTEVYHDGVDLSYESLYQMLDREPILKTSQPSPGEFIELYKGLSTRFHDIISIHVTSRASGTMQAAILARESLPDLSIEVVDSGTTSMALGFIAMAAAAAAKVGRRKEEIMRVIEDAKRRADIYVAIPVLTQLRRSGKIGMGQAFIGSLLSVKPVLTMRGGMLEVCDRVRTYPRAVDRVVELVTTAAGGSRVKLAVLYSKTRDEASRLAEVLESRLKVTESIITELGAALAVHGGPGILGAAIYRED
jgi:DegV family protein with EDD domain